MQAVILAAGMGKRLKELTRSNTKCMVKVNGVTLIDRMLHQLETRELSKIIIVVGYEGEKLIEYVNTLRITTPIVFITNPIYDKTNNIYSLSLAKEHLCRDDTILLESDLIFEDAVLDILLDDPMDTLALVDRYESWMDGTCVTLNEDGSVKAFIPGNRFRFEETGNYYKTVNIYKFSKHFSSTRYVPFLEAYQRALGVNEYYEQVLRVIAMLDDSGIKAKKLNGQLWYEIDDVQDLDIAESMFHPRDEQRLDMIYGRFGGYWRYPQLMDFCYLVNPYFPPQRMMDEIKASFEKLLAGYPSGMKVNSLLAAKNFGLHPEHILVGNGAAELIKLMMERVTGRVGIVSPTFEEYRNRYDAKQIVCYRPNREDFSYSATDLTEFFGERRVDNLILINPDNPTGNYIPKADLMELIAWTKNQRIKLIVDESFADFALEKNNTLLSEEILTSNPDLYVIKSISKSYGVPGLRLGIMASGNEKIIKELKTDAAVWNINSFAEFYMQIEEKYKSDYVASLEKMKEARVLFKGELDEIEGIHVIPSQANYFTVEITNGLTVREISKRLLCEDKILVKDLTQKIRLENRQFLRVAVRTAEDNHLLAKALSRIIKGENGNGKQSF